MQRYDKPDMVDYGPNGFNLQSAYVKNFVALPNADAEAFSRAKCAQKVSFVLHVSRFSSSRRALYMF